MPARLTLKVKIWRKSRWISLPRSANMGLARMTANFGSGWDQRVRNGWASPSRRKSRICSRGTIKEHGMVPQGVPSPFLSSWSTLEDDYANMKLWHSIIEFDSEGDMNLAVHFARFIANMSRC